LRTIASLTLAATALGCSSHVPPPERPEPTDTPGTPYTNTVRWSTASEVDNFGFDVYRSDREEGPFERITASPLLGAVTTDIPQRYEWVDTEIDPSRAYHYYVESISMTGVRERFTPVIRAKPKLPRAAAE
jgi:hypothetical protein